MKRKTVAELRAEIDRRAREELTKQLASVEATVQDHVNHGIRSIAAAALGFADRWDDWEVDHCNGRKTAIAGRIGELAMAAVKSSIDEAIVGLLAEPATKKRIKAAMRRELEEQIDECMRDAVRERVQQEAPRIVAQMFDAQEVDSE